MAATQTLTLTDFLLARIAEDEAVARAAIPFGTGEWETYTTGAWVTGVRQSVAGNIICHARSRPNGSNDHIARHDPARVLAECEAKRQIVELHRSWPVLAQQPPEFEGGLVGDPESVTLRMSQRMAWLTEQEYRAKFGDEPPTSPVLRLLALPYADHPDYRDEWRP